MKYDTFDTLALYSIDKFLLGGKIFINSSIKIVSSLTYNCIVFQFDDNKLSILKKKKENKKIGSLSRKISAEEHSYSDTIKGDEYFLPTIYLNDLGIKYNIYKIINIYIPNKNSEIINSNLNEENKSKIHIYILYIDSKSENSEFNNDKRNNNTGTNDTNQDNQIIFNSFMREKVSLGLLSYNIKTNEYLDFETLFDGVDENAIDFTILEKENERIHDNFAVIFTAYNLQIINLKSKTSTNYIMNNQYNFIFSKLYPDSNKYQINNYFIETENNLDLRGSGFLVLNSASFIFNDSKGKLIYSAFDESNILHFDEIKIDNEYSRLCAPYNKILMPFVNIFYLSSSFSDGIVLTCNEKESNYKITDRIISYAPIVNFHLVNDLNNNARKLAFTSGYGENSILSFVYDQFLFYEFPKNYVESYDIDYMKSIPFTTNNITKYILCKLRNAKLVVLNGDLINISNEIEYNKDFNIVNFGEMKINDEKIIILVFENEIRFYNENFKLLFTFNNYFYNENFLVKDAKVGEKFVLLFNNNKECILLGLYCYKIKDNKSNNIIEIKINENMYIRYKSLTSLLYKDSNDVIKVNMISKLYLNKYNFLSVYRNNTFLEIYDITEFLEFKDNMLIDDNENENNFKLLLKSSYVNYLPSLILDDNLNLNLLYRSNSSPNIDFSESLSKIFKLDNYQSNNTNNINNNSELTLTLKSSVSFSIDSPDFVYFESLGNICILTLTFKSGLLVIYTLYISEMNNDNTEIKSIGFKKSRIERLKTIDFREFFRLKVDNLFIPFNNINKRAGILFNLEKNQKIIYEVNGELCVLKINRNNENSTINCFCDYAKEEHNEGFLISDGGLMKFCHVIKDYNLSNYSLLIKSNKINRFPVILTYTPEYRMNYTFYSYIMIEKEMISPSLFQYYMTLRKEEENNIVHEIQFEPNEVITECNVIELPLNLKNINKTKKYIAVGINIINYDTSEEGFINGKIKFFDKENNKYELINANEGFKGVITMIQSLYNLILVTEGSKINIYLFNPENFSMTIYKYIENKNLSISNWNTNNKLLLTGDIIDSFNFMYIRNNNLSQIEIVVDTKDNNHIKVTTCILWTIHNKKCCIVFDEENNGYIFFLSENTSTKICDFHLGKTINEIRHLSLKGNEYYSYYYSSLNGSVGFINHIENNVYEQLEDLCEFIYYHFPFNSGVNPKSFYSLNFGNNNVFKKPQGRFIDFRILDVFLKLSDKFQDIICNNILGVDKEVIIKNIYELFE